MLQHIVLGIVVPLHQVAFRVHLCQQAALLVVPGVGGVAILIGDLDGVAEIIVDSSLLRTHLSRGCYRLAAAGIDRCYFDLRIHGASETPHQIVFHFCGACAAESGRAHARIGVRGGRQARHVQGLAGLLTKGVVGPLGQYIVRTQLGQLAAVGVEVTGGGVACGIDGLHLVAEGVVAAGDFQALGYRICHAQGIHLHGGTQFADHAVIAVVLVFSHHPACILDGLDVAYFVVAVRCGLAQIVGLGKNAIIQVIDVIQAVIVGIGLGNDIAHPIVGGGLHQVQALRVEYLLHLAVVQVVDVDGLAHRVGIGGGNNLLAGLVVGRIPAEVGDGAIHVGKGLNAVVEVVGVATGARVAGVRVQDFLQQITGGVISVLRDAAIGLSDGDRATGAVVVGQGHPVVAAGGGNWCDIVVHRAGVTLRIEARLYLIADAVVSKGVERTFRIEDRRQAVGAVEVVAGHAAESVDGLGAVAQRIVAILGAVLLAVDIGGLAVVEVVLHPHRALIGGAGSAGDGDLVAHGIEGVFGAGTVGIDHRRHAAVAVVLVAGLGPYLDAAGAALQHPLEHLAAGLVVDALGNAALGVLHPHLAVGPVVKVQGGARRGAIEAVGGLGHAGAVAHRIVGVGGDIALAVGHGQHAVGGVVGEAVGLHLGTGGLVRVVLRRSRVHQVLADGDQGLVAEGVVADAGGEALAIGDRHLAVQQVVGVGGGACVAAVGEALRGGEDIAALIVAVDGQGARRGQAGEHAAQLVEGVELLAAVGVDDAGLVAQHIVLVLGDATHRVLHLGDAVVQVVVVIGVALQARDTHGLDCLALVAGAVEDILHAHAFAVDQGHLAVVQVVLVAGGLLFRQARRDDHGSAITCTVVGEFGALALAVDLGGLAVVAVVLERLGARLGQPHGQRLAAEVTVAVVGESTGHLKRVDRLDDAVVLVVAVIGHAHISSAEGLMRLGDIAVGIQLVVRHHALGVGDVRYPVGLVVGVQGAALVRRALRLDHRGAVAALVVCVRGHHVQRTGLAHDLVDRVVVVTGGAAGVAGLRLRHTIDRAGALIVKGHALHVADVVVHRFGQVALGAQLRHLSVDAVEEEACLGDVGAAQVAVLAHAGAVAYFVVAVFGAEALAAYARGQAIGPIVLERHDLVVRAGQRGRQCRRVDAVQGGHVAGFGLQVAGIVVTPLHHEAFGIHARHLAVGAVEVVGDDVAAGIDHFHLVAGSVVAVLDRMQLRVGDVGQAVVLVEAVAGGIAARVGHGNTVAIGVVVEGYRLVQRVGLAHQLVVGIVGVGGGHRVGGVGRDGDAGAIAHLVVGVGGLHTIGRGLHNHTVEQIVAPASYPAQRIGSGDAVAHVVVGVSGHLAFGIGDGDQAIDLVVGVAGGVTIAVGHGEAVARFVIGVADGLAFGVGAGQQAVGRVIGVDGGVAVAIDCGQLVADTVIGVFGAVALTVDLRRQAIGTVILEDNRLVPITGHWHQRHGRIRTRDRCHKQGLGYTVAGGIVGPGGDIALGINLGGPLVALVEVAHHGIAARIGGGHTIAVGVVGEGGGLVQRIGAAGQPIVLVVGIDRGLGQRGVGRDGDAGAIAHLVVGVGGLHTIGRGLHNHTVEQIVAPASYPAQRIGSGDAVAHVVVGVSGHLAFGIGDGDQAIDLVVGVAGGVTIAVGHGEAVARFVIGVADGLAFGVGAGQQAVGRVIGVDGGVAVAIDCGQLVADTVIGVFGAVALTVDLRRQAIGTVILEDNRLVPITGHWHQRHGRIRTRDRCHKQGLGYTVAGGIVGPGGDIALGINLGGPLVALVEVAHHGIAARIGGGHTIAVGVVGEGGGLVQRIGAAGQPIVLVVGIDRGLGQRGVGGDGHAGAVAQLVVGVGGLHQVRIDLFG